MAAVATNIRALSVGVDERALAAQVRQYLDTTYPDLASLSPAAGSSTKRASWNSSGKSRRSLEDDIAHWRTQESEARSRLDAAEKALPGAIEAATAALTAVLDRAQSVSLERYALSDAVAVLLAELSSSAPRPEIDDEDDIWGEEEAKESGARVKTLLEKVEDVHAALARSQAALAWSSVLERILKMR
jgi:glutathione S-transferase